MRFALAAALLALTAIPAFAQDEMVTLQPAQFGEIFCMARIGNDMGPVTGILSPQLTDDIAKAQAVNDEWAEGNPDDKPPLGDGIPWQSWPDYAPGCTVGEVTESGETSEVELRYAFPDSPDANFADTLLLKKVALDEFGTSVWRIDNVRYGDSGDLRQFLAGIFTE